MDVHSPKNGINRYWSIPIWGYWVTEPRMTPRLRGSIRQLIVRAVPCCGFNHEPPHSLWFPSMMKIPALPFARGWRLDPIPRDLQRVFGSVMWKTSAEIYGKVNRRTSCLSPAPGGYRGQRQFSECEGLSRASSEPGSQWSLDVVWILETWM